MADILRELLGNRLIDTHAHVHDYDESELSSLLENCKNLGVAEIWSFGIDIASSKRNIELAEDYSQIKAGAGLDPELLVPGSELYLGENIHFDDWLEEQIAQLRELLLTKNVTLVGECGIDTYHLFRKLRKGEITEEFMRESIRRQEVLFRRQLELADKFCLPVSIHGRNYEQACLNIVKDYPSVTAIFHSFTGGYKSMKAIQSAGHYLGVNAILGYQSADQLRTAYRKLLGNEELSNKDTEWFYDHKIVFETDSPWLHPTEITKRNEPANVALVLATMGKLGLV